MKKSFLIIFVVFVLFSCNLFEPAQDEWGNNLVINGDFNDSQTNWTTWISTGWGGEGEISYSDGKATIIIDNQGEECWAVVMIYEGLTLEQDQTYQFKFRAKSDEKRVIRTDIGGEILANPPYLYYQDVELDTEWKTYTFEFTMPFDTDENSRINFYCGYNVGAFLPDDTTWTSDELYRTSSATVYIDDVELRKHQ